MFKYIALLLLALIFIVVLLSVIFGYYGGFQRPQDSKNISHLFVEKDGKILMPPFEVEIQWSEEAKKKIEEEGIETTARLMLGGPHKYVYFARPGGVLVADYDVKLNEDNVLVFDNILFPKHKLNRVEDYDCNVLLNFFFSKKPTNLEENRVYDLDVGFFEKDISEAYGKRHTLKGKISK